VRIALLGLWLNPTLSLANDHSVVDIQTNRGLITLQLEDAAAPTTVSNFLGYVNESFYDNTLFHRVINKFMIQGGGYSIDMERQETHAPIALETGNNLSNVRGTIAMARLDEPDTATSQFFINTVDNTRLDYQSFSAPGYAVFGQVIEGMDVVDAISDEATGNFALAGGTLRDVPQSPVIIEVVRLRQGQLAFSEMPSTYTAGDTLDVHLEETMERDSTLDLWVAVLTPEGRFIFVTETGFSDTAVVFKEAVPVDETSHSIFNFTVPEGLAGHFILFAIFNNPEDGLEDLDHSLRSNLAQFEIDLVE